MIDNTKEYIACAANWYKDLPIERMLFDHTELLPASHIYPKNVDRGVVFCGHRHLQCMYMMICIYKLKQHEAGEEEQGFLTSKNRFVDREEGLEIAIAAGQVEKGKTYSNTSLFSEDLY